MDNARRAQQRLRDRGYDVAVDGDFGGQSIAALMSFVGQRPTVSPLRLDLGKAAAKYFRDAGITTPIRIAHAVAQQCVETTRFSTLVENLNYSIDGLKATFNRNRISAADCERLGRQPGEASVPAARQEQIANIIYGGVFGSGQLGNNQSGDGFRFRGRGAKQTTGRSNYTTVKGVTGLDVLTHPELLEDPDTGMHAATIFWQHKNCNPFADADDIVGLTQTVNGGQNAIADRKAALLRAKTILL